MIINNRTFAQVCKELRGYDVYTKKGIITYKYELFYKGISPNMIKANQTKYTLKIRPR